MKVTEVPADADTALWDELVASLTEGTAILRSVVELARFYTAPVAVDVRAIRKKMGMTQAGRLLSGSRVVIRVVPLAGIWCDG